MLTIRWRKVLLDLLAHKSRTLLVVLAIAVGVLAVGFISIVRSVLLRELQRNYETAVVSSATLFTDPFDADLAESIARMPEVSLAEARRSVRVRVQVAPDEWKDLVLTAVPDYDNVQVDRLFPRGGAWPPPDRTILLEQQSRDYVGASVGDTLLIELNDGRQRELPVSGIAYDSRVPNADLIGLGFAFVTSDTLDALGLGSFYTEMRFRVADNVTSEAHIRQVMTEVEDKIEKSGRAVRGVSLPPPGEHPVQEIIEALVFILGVFGVLTLFLSGFLVINTISALITQQIRQIGVMKMVGGKQLQIMGMYFMMVLGYGALATLIGIPLALGVSRPTIDFATGLLNVEVATYQVPFTVLLLQISVGLLVPLLSALWPVISGVQITTRAALSSVGISSASNATGLIERGIALLQNSLRLKRPFLIAIRNTLRKKGRIALTLTTLILGTALFIGVLSVRASVELTVGNFMRYYQYDVDLNFARTYRQMELLPLLDSLPTVVEAEGWLRDSSRRVLADDRYGENFTLIAVPPQTSFMRPALEAGRWLQADDQNSLVVNADWLAEEADLALGDSLTLEINGRESAWQIVGVVPPAANGPVAYASYAPYSRLTGRLDQVNTLKVVADGGRTQGETAVFLDEALEAAGLQISSTNTTERVRESTSFQFNIVIIFLVMMAALLAIVGGLGLTTTMSINILERIREIGVLRAIGASDTAVQQIVLAEGIIIGLISWVIGTILAVPISQLLSDQIGMALLGIPLDFSFSYGGAVAWLAALLLIAVLASLGPARRASRLTIREVLAYE